jgi:hypothetical protein
MSDAYKNIQWVAQRNLTNREDLQELKSGCEKAGVHFLEMDIIPFTGKLPAFDKSRHSIFYGSTTLGQLVIAEADLRKGFFYDADSFSIENYFKKWGKHMLNFGASVTSFYEFMAGSYDQDKIFFIRPDDDSKSFSGQVIRYAEIANWYDNLKTIENAGLSLDTKIIVSEPYHLKYEWRLWIVNRKVIGASKYREEFRLKKERGCPPEVKLFAEERCGEFTPHDIFVMDICQTGDHYYIVECGCMNSAGFYKGDIESIVSNVTEHFSTVII